MIVGEDKNKVENIVKPAIAEFENIYSYLIEEYLKPDSEVGKWRLKVYWNCQRLILLLNS